MGKRVKELKTGGFSWLNWEDRGREGLRSKGTGPHTYGALLVGVDELDFGTG